MRTFGEIANDIKVNKLYTMQRAMQELEKENLRDFERTAANKIIENCRSVIDNLPEVTVIELGATVNSLIKAIQKAYKLHLTEYWQDFEKFAEDYIIGLTPEGNLKNGMYFGQSQCFDLGLNVNDLLCFKGQNPMDDKVVNLFRQTMNNRYGINIPMSGMEEQALRDYESVAFGNDEIAKDKAFVHLKEVQRDSGTLRNGGTYYILATNQHYQEAKSRCESKSL